MLTRKLVCPSCDATLKVADTLAPGKMIRCPKCESAFPVPRANGRAEALKAGAPRSRKAAPPPAEEDDLDEEEYERPVPRKRRKKPKKAAGSNLPLIIGGAVLLLCVAA